MPPKRTRPISFCRLLWSSSFAFEGGNHEEPNRPLVPRWTNPGLGPGGAVHGRAETQAHQQGCRVARAGPADLLHWRARWVWGGGGKWADLGRLPPIRG